MTAALASPPYAIRNLRDDDHGYILDTWRKGFAGSSGLYRFDRELYHRVLSRYVRQVLRAPGVHVRIACDPANVTTILGFCVTTHETVQYVYVRNSLLRLGIARALLSGLPVVTYATRTKEWEDRFKPADRGWAYAPPTFTGRDGKISVEIS